MARSDKGDEQIERSEADVAPNPVWFKPVMIGFMLLGLVWVLVFYLSNMAFPIPGIGAVEPRHRLRHRLHRLPDDHPLEIARNYTRVIRPQVWMNLWITSTASPNATLTLAAQV